MRHRFKFSKLVFRSALKKLRVFGDEFLVTQNHAHLFPKVSSKGVPGTFGTDQYAGAVYSIKY